MVCRRFFVLVMLSWSRMTRPANCEEIHEFALKPVGQRPVHPVSMLQVWMLCRLLCATGSPATQDISAPNALPSVTLMPRLVHELGSILGGGGRVISCELNLAQRLVEGCRARSNESPIAFEVSAHIARRIIKWAGAEAEVEAPGE